MTYTLRFSQTSSNAQSTLSAHFTGKCSAWNDAEHLLLAEELPVHPGDLAGVAVVAVDVGVLAEERVGALRRREPAHAAQRRQVEPGVVLLAGVDVAVAERADALQVERLEDRDRGPAARGSRSGSASRASDRRRAGRSRTGGGSDRAGSGARPSSGRSVGIEPVSASKLRRSTSSVRQELVVVVPHDLDGDLRILRVDVRERLTGDVVLRP